MWVTLHGEIQDPEFPRFLEELGTERLAAFDLEDLLLVDLIHREQKVPSDLAGRVAALLDHGVIERVGTGRRTRYLLSAIRRQTCAGATYHMTSRA